MELATNRASSKTRQKQLPTVMDSSLAVVRIFILPVLGHFRSWRLIPILIRSGRLVFIEIVMLCFYRTNAHTWAKLSSGSISSVWGI